MREGHIFFWPLKKLGHEKLGSEEKGGSQDYAHIIITGIFFNVTMWHKWQSHIEKTL